MSDIVIRATGLGKKYRIRHEQKERYTTLRDVITKKARRLFDGNTAVSKASTVEDFWALRNISFEINRGEAVGIVGRNGAGKSTLLKILSRITEPSSGRVELEGNVASLLEVGTGFHPELTGRENIFLNGAILGMSKADIAGRFDEIVSFAGVERFLDTPVKRYSSGMYVRLAFSVAAHVEPDVLVIDEVLAVGDIEFQRKCLGKMSAAAAGGKTVLFVSHNMAAINSLTTRCLVLQSGGILMDGPTADALASYTATFGANDGETAGQFPGAGAHTQVHTMRLLDEAGNSTTTFGSGSPIAVETVVGTDGQPGLSLELFLKDSTGQPVGLVSLHQFHGLNLPSRRGKYRLRFLLSVPSLASGEYSFDVATSIVNSNWDHFVTDAARFHVPFSNLGGQPWDFRQSLGYGNVAIALATDPEVISLDA